jgi:DNA-binding transcriptional ArsR family regulator
MMQFRPEDPTMVVSRDPTVDWEALQQAAECLRILAHPHRLRIVQMLLRGEFTVGELAQACALPSAMASEHLRLMQRCGFLHSARNGRRVYYRVAEPQLKKILNCVEERFGRPVQRPKPAAPRSEVST